MLYRNIEFNIDDKIYIISINRPEYNNKLNLDLTNEIINALLHAKEDKCCRAVVLTGKGKYFCNGGELGDFREKSSIEIREFGEKFIELHTLITVLDKPVIAAVQGDAMGGGFNLVEACDLAIAASDAVFGVPEIKDGIAPMMALSGLSGLLSRKGVMELALFGETIISSKAVEIGLVNEICEKKEVLDLAIKRAKKLVEFNPTAIALCKKLYIVSEALNYQKKLESGLNMLISLLKSDDAIEALTAKEEERKPKWKYK